MCLGWGPVVRLGAALGGVGWWDAVLKWRLSGSEGGGMLARVSMHYTLTLEPCGVLCDNRRSVIMLLRQL